MKSLLAIVFFNFIVTSSFTPFSLASIQFDDDLELELEADDDDNFGLGQPQRTKSATPSQTCKLIVETFGWAVSNFTLCSVRNARPIHLCQECVKEYLMILQTHHKFLATIDEQGNPCREYFINLDRLQIVSEAYKYTHHLWKKANCKYCFKNDVNGTMTAEPTEETVRFNKCYRATKNCFKNHTRDSNETCHDCSAVYNELTEVYIEIQDGVGGDQICMDIVDTMNITREIWSHRFNCSQKPQTSLSLQIGIGMMSVIPIVFYLLAFILSHKQEADVFQQKRMAEVFAVNSSGSSFAGPSPFSRIIPRRHVQAES